MGVVKQSSAFPPNFVHSLDSTHMLQTAAACTKDGLTFAAIHDSYWTHAASVDVMNLHTRQQFLLLHEAPLLDNLLRFFVRNMRAGRCANSIKSATARPTSY